MPTVQPSDDFEALYTDHYDFLWRCALRLGAAPSEVEDVVQEAFIVALRRYDPAGFGSAATARPSTWLFSILHNILRNHNRSERRRRARLELLRDDDPPLERMQAEVALGLRLLDEFLDTLDHDRRVVFVLVELEGMRAAEVAQTLGVSANTIRSRLRAGRQAFAKHFGSDGERLCERAANVAAPDEARARGWVVLSSPLAASVSTTATGTLGVGSIIATLGSLAAAVAIAVLVGGSSREQPEAEQPAAVEPPTANVVSSSLAVGDAQPELAVDEDDELPPIPVLAAKPRTRAGSSASEAAARERLAQARRALLDGDAQAALTLVDDGASWPATLDAHRVALEIGALCALDRPQQARERAQTWQLAHPHASTAISLRAACWSDDNALAVGGH